jgi:hypothetical protein
MVALVIVALLGMILVVLPTFLVRPHSELDREKLLKARNDVRTAGIQIVGGTALLAGLLFTNRTLGLNQQGQITDRFTKATDQLGSEKLSTRLGGIYSLERIARDSKPDQGPVMEVLTAFVRDHAGAPTATSTVGSSTTTTPIPPTDVQAALTVVGRRIGDNDPPDYTLDLDRSNLSKAILSNADFSGAILERADLSLVDLADANVSGAILTGADLSLVNLTRANLTLAHLSGANLSRADLENADLTGADLRGADLRVADLTGADLRGAVDLSQDQVNSAFTDRSTKLPRGRNPSQREPPSP